VSEVASSVLGSVDSGDASEYAAAAARELPAVALSALPRWVLALGDGSEEAGHRGFIQSHLRSESSSNGISVYE